MTTVPLFRQLDSMDWNASPVWPHLPSHGGQTLWADILGADVARTKRDFKGRSFAVGYCRGRRGNRFSHHCRNGVGGQTGAGCSPAVHCSLAAKSLCSHLQNPSSPLSLFKERDRGEVVYMTDPARGLRTLTLDEFEDGWLSTTDIEGKRAGVALLLEPTPVFYEQTDEQPPGLGLGRLLGYLRPHRYLVGQLGLGLLLGSGLQLLLPFLTQSIVDVGINTKNLSFIYLVLAAQLALMLGRTAVEFLRSWILLHLSTRINIAILTDFLVKLMKLPMSFFDTKNFGDLLQRVNDHHRIEQFLTGQTLQTLFSLVNLVVFGLVLLTYNLTIFGLFAGATTLYGLWVANFLRHRRKLAHVACIS